MLEEVFYELYDFGFSQKEIDDIENNNDYIFNADAEDIRKILDFLRKKGLEKQDIINLINDNPFMLTESDKRIDYYENIYNNVLKLNKEELITLLKSFSECYTSRPKELEKTINYLRNKNISLEQIKKIVLNNPKIIDLKIEEVIQLIEGVNHDA